VRIAVLAATQAGSPWREETLMVRRLAGALACRAELDVLVAGGTPIPGERDAAVRVLRFAGEEAGQRHRDAYLRAAFGLADFHQPTLCTCAEILTRDLAARIPLPLQRRLAELACPESAELRAHLRRERYDAVVVAGYEAAPLVEDAGCARLVLVPLARDEPSFHLAVYDPLFEQAAAIVVFTEAERRLVGRRVGKNADPRVRNVGFVLRSNPAAAGTTLHAASDLRFLLVARDWGQSFAMEWLVRVVRGLTRRFSDLKVYLVGPGIGGVDDTPGIVRRTVRSRLDVERWMSRALAVFDPEPNRLLGREVIEALLLGTPVIVPACGGATREHAESGDGGLWYRSEAEVEECVALLGDSDLRTALGRQGRAYAESRYGDPDEFTRRAIEAVCF
jgi:glycosyltransferase involved in cell wall biosynthesis